MEHENSILSELRSLLDFRSCPVTQFEDGFFSHAKQINFQELTFTYLHALFHQNNL